MAKTLPERPNLDWLKKAAKDRLAGLRVQDPSARLHQAQLDIARDYGFASWRALKAHVDARSLNGQVVAAALAGDVVALGRLLQAHPRKLALTGGPWNAPLLHLAAERGHLDCVDLLLRLGSPVDARDRADKATALHWAAAGGHLEVGRRLLAAGADVDGANDAHDIGVIGWATCFRTVHRDFAELLLERGARPTILSSVALGREDLVRALVRDDPSCLDPLRMSRFDHHRTALHLVVLKNQPAMVRLLIELGADPRAHDSRGYAPIDFVKPETDPAIADMLVAAGATPATRRSNRFERLVPVLRVASITASLDYYVDKLGFRTNFEWGNPPTFASVARDGVEIFLSQEPAVGPTSLSVFVQDVDRLHDDYRATGALIRRPPFNFPWGVRGMDVEDIDGHHLRFSGDGGEENRSP
jgi:catechol 2,3-dioxygenase-like lactoylglutathione lyase family enzyme